MEPIKTITVDGQEFSIEKFSQDVQQLVLVHQKWEEKLVDARLETALVERALRDLNKDLTLKIKSEVEAFSEVKTEEASSEEPVSEDGE